MEAAARTGGLRTTRARVLTGSREALTPAAAGRATPEGPTVSALLQEVSLLKELGLWPFALC